MTAEFDLERLVPGIGSNGDACESRLEKKLAAARGVDRVHVETRDGVRKLCIHYDPDVSSLEAIRRLAAQAGTEIAQRYRHELIRIEGMDCSDCTGAIEHALRRMDGMLAASVNYASQTVRVEYDAESLSRGAIQRRIRGMGYGLPALGLTAAFARWRPLASAVVAGAFVLAGWLAERRGVAPGAVWVLYGAAYLAGGWDIARHAVHALRERRFDTDLLMVLAALGAAALGELFEGGLLLFLFSLGHALEELALDRARDAVRKLGELAPRTAVVRRGDRDVEVDVAELAPGDLIVVRPGVRIPADGTVVTGASAVNQAPLTGESLPVDKEPGSKVFAGTVNGDGALEVKVTRLARDNTLARVMQMVEEAQMQKTRTQQLTERFTAWFVPAVLGGTVLLVAVPLAFGADFAGAFLRAMTFLVACSPCALALGTPSAMLAGIAQAARNGLLIKGGVHLEALGSVTTMAFDKTGTLTHGRPEVTEIVAAELDAGTDRLLAVAAAVESLSAHPLAQAVVRVAAGRGLAVPKSGPLTSFTGRGIRADVEGDAVLIGNRKLLAEFSVPIPGELASRMEGLEADGNTTMIVAIGGRAAGLIALADTPRSDAAETLQRLRQMGIRQTILLTGDNRRVGERMGAVLGLDTVRAELMPEDKVAAIRELAAGEAVAMVGDGVNDAPALAAATVGIAMGSAGTDVALETADVALMGDELGKLPFAVGLGRATRAVVRQNLAISIAVIGFLMIASVVGGVGIAVAILFHEGSTLVVVANALRLLTYRLVLRRSDG